MHLAAPVNFPAILKNNIKIVEIMQ
jgi:hypothetical protein